MAEANRKIVFWEVDAQQDFMLPSGRLYVPGAEKIIPNIKRLVDTAQKAKAFVVSSACSHSEGDPEFATFPPHCIRGTEGARIVPEGLTRDYITVQNTTRSSLPQNVFDHEQVIIEKQELDVFSNPHTHELIERIGHAADYFVFGVVTEYCVHFAAKGLLERGRKVHVVKDAIETLKAEESQRALGELKALGAKLISTEEAIQRALSASAARAPR